MNVDYRIRLWHVDKGLTAGPEHRDAPQQPTEAETGTRTGIQEWLASEGLTDTTWVLVNNLPQYWYGATRKGFYYWSGSDQLYGPEGPFLLFGNRSDDEVSALLTMAKDCRYILTTRDLSEYGDRFLPYLNSHCTFIAQGPQYLLLYRVRAGDRPGS
jgi:hypothetical protein